MFFLLYASKEFHKISSFVLDIFSRRHVFGKLKKRLSIIIFGQFHVKRFVSFVAERFGKFEADRLVAEVNSGIGSPFLQEIDIAFFIR